MKQRLVSFWPGGYCGNNCILFRGLVVLKQKRDKYAEEREPGDKQYLASELVKQRIKVQQFQLPTVASACCTAGSGNCNTGDLVIHYPGCNDPSKQYLKVNGKIPGLDPDARIPAMILQKSSSWKVESTMYRGNLPLLSTDSKEKQYYILDHHVPLLCFPKRSAKPLLESGQTHLWPHSESHWMTSITSLPVICTEL